MSFAQSIFIFGYVEGHPNSKNRKVSRTEDNVETREENSRIQEGLPHLISAVTRADISKFKLKI